MKRSVEVILKRNDGAERLLGQFIIDENTTTEDLLSGDPDVCGNSQDFFEDDGKGIANAILWLGQGKIESDKNSKFRNVANQKLKR